MFNVAFLASLLIFPNLNFWQVQPDSPLQPLETSIGIDRKVCTAEPKARLSVKPFSRGKYKGQCPGLSYQRPVVMVDEIEFLRDFPEANFVEGTYYYVANIQIKSGEFYTAAIPKDNLQTIVLQMRGFLGGFFAHSQFRLTFEKPVFLFSQAELQGSKNNIRPKQTFSLILSGQGLGLTDQFNPILEGLTNNLVLVGAIFTTEAKHQLQVVELEEKDIKQFELDLNKEEMEKVLNYYFEISQIMGGETTYSSINNNSNNILAEVVLKSVGIEGSGAADNVRTVPGVEKFYKNFNLIRKELPLWHVDEESRSSFEVIEVPKMNSLTTKI